MEVSLSAASRMTGTSKSTLFRALKSGRLSARREDAGSYLIDVAELGRVFPITNPERAVAQPVARSGTAGTDDTDLAVLRVKLEAAEAALGRERGLVEDYQERLSRAEERAERAEERERVLGLTVERFTAPAPSMSPPADPAPAPAAAVPSAAPEPAPTPRPSFLSRLLGALQPG